MSLGKMERQMSLIVPTIDALVALRGRYMPELDPSKIPANNP